MKRWYVVYVSANMEKRIRFIMDRKFKGTSLLYPKCEMDVVRNGQIKTILSPVFPNYMLLQTNLDEDPSFFTKLIRDTPITKVLKDADNKPYPLSDEEFNHIMDLTTKKIEVNKKKFIGRKLLIKKGPYANLYGNCVAVVRGTNKIFVEIDFNGFLMKSQIKIDQIQLEDEFTYYEE